MRGVRRVLWPEAASQILPHPAAVQPTDLVKGRPQLGGLVDVNLARLLRVRLAKLLAHPQTLEPPDEHASLARQVRRAVQPQVGRQRDLVPVQQVCVGIAAEVDGCPSPVHLEAARPIRQGFDRWTVVGQRAKVLVFTVRCHRAAMQLRCGADAVGSGVIARFDVADRLAALPLSRLGDLIGSRSRLGNKSADGGGGQGFSRHDMVVALVSRLTIVLELRTFVT